MNMWKKNPTIYVVLGELIQYDIDFIYFYCEI